ncbi:hypothetical protein STEG23_006182, partial [Scotinomys teguina]
VGLETKIINFMFHRQAKTEKQRLPSALLLAQYKTGLIISQTSFALEETQLLFVKKRYLYGLIIYEMKKTTVYLEHISTFKSYSVFYEYKR